jgi:hypothetical protein
MNEQKLNEGVESLVVLRRGKKSADVLWNLPLRVATREVRRLNGFLGHQRKTKGSP